MTALGQQREQFGGVHVGRGEELVCRVLVQAG